MVIMQFQVTCRLLVSGDCDRREIGKRHVTWNFMINELKSGGGGSSSTLMTLDQSEEQLFKTFRVSEEEKMKFKKALKRARRKTQTLERMIIKDEYY